MNKAVLMYAAGVTKTFFKSGQAIPILRQIDLEIKEAELLAITGASGVGKSTFLHILGTLEPPSSGQLFFGPKKKDLFCATPAELSHFRNRCLGFVFQFHYLLPEFSALENVMMPALIAGQARRSLTHHAKELLDFVGLSERFEHRPAELSGGEQQRVAIARAVMMRPQLILADELTGNLDSANRRLVMELLLRLNQATGVAILLVTHDRELAACMSRVLVMQDGKFVSDPGKRG